VLGLVGNQQREVEVAVHCATGPSGEIAFPNVLRRLVVQHVYSFFRSRVRVPCSRASGDLVCPMVLPRPEPIGMKNPIGRCATCVSRTSNPYHLLRSRALSLPAFACPVTRQLCTTLASTPQRRKAVNAVRGSRSCTRASVVLGRE